MKYLASALLLSQASGFAFIPKPRAQTTHLFAADYMPVEGEGKINLKVSSGLFSLKVMVESISSGPATLPLNDAS